GGSGAPAGSVSFDGGSSAGEAAECVPGAPGSVVVAASEEPKGSPGLSVWWVASSIRVPSSLKSSFVRTRVPVGREKSPLGGFSPRGSHLSRVSEFRAPPKYLI